MKILTYPHESLRMKCKAVESVSPELQDVAKAMFSTMIENNGIGLAANQVGLDIRLIVMMDENGGPLYLFNPVIQQQKTPKILEEGCLSAPGEFFNVRRNLEVSVKYRDINNKMQFVKLTGLLAQVVQHEIGHLNGEDFREKAVTDDKKD